MQHGGQAGGPDSALRGWPAALKHGVQSTDQYYWYDPTLHQMRAARSLIAQSHEHTQAKIFTRTRTCV